MGVGAEKGTRILVTAAGRDVPRRVVTGVVNGLRMQEPQALIDVLLDEPDWSAASGPHFEWLERVRQAHYDRAIIVGDGTVSPHALGYALYLAGVSERVGVSDEFGGKVLTLQLRPRGPGRYPSPAEFLGQRPPSEVD